MRKSLLFFIFVVLTSVVGHGQTDWYIFRGDQELNAYVRGKIPSTLKIKASYQTGDEIVASPVVAGNVIFVGSGDGFFYAVGMDGKLVWKYNTGNAIEAPALLLNGKVVFGTLDGTLYCLDQKMGSCVEIPDRQPNNGIAKLRDSWGKDNPRRGEL